MKAHDVIKKLVVTEKAMGGSDANTYVLHVDLKSNKNNIKEVVEKMFNVEVKSVKTSVLKGKVKVVGKKRKKKQAPDVKKAYVTLSKGSIDMVPKV